MIQKHQIQLTGIRGDIIVTLNRTDIKDKEDIQHELFEVLKQGLKNSKLCDSSETNIKLNLKNEFHINDPSKAAVSNPIEADLIEYSNLNELKNIVKQLKKEPNNSSIQGKLIVIKFRD